MKKSLLLLTGILILSSCQDDNLKPLAGEVKNENTEELASRFAIPVDSALSYLNEFLDSEELTTRGESRRKVSEVFPVKYASITTRAQAAASECDNLIYVANFENEGGYAILAADERIPDKVIAVTDQGNMNHATVLAASQPPIADRPLYKDYPLVGDGFFTLPEYGDELFMNPNTASLQIDSVGDTLVGNFDGELISDGLNGNGDSVNGVSSTDLFPVSLCTYYATQGIGDNPGDRIPDITTPYQPSPNPDLGGGGGSPTTTVLITKSDWTIKKRTSSLLWEYVDWHQDSPFNDNYPKRREWIIAGRREKAPAGCFPLAIAKIMTHFQIPNSFIVNGFRVNWSGLKSKSSSNVEQKSAAALLYGISIGCGSWYFYQGTFTFPNKAKDYLKWVGLKNVNLKSYTFDYVVNMVDNSKPLIIYAVPGINVSASHAWNIDGYKIKERTITKMYYRNNALVNTTTETETCKMVHCDFGSGGKANGYYVSGVFKYNDPESEKDYIYDGSNKEKTNYNHYIHLVTYDLP